MSPRREWAYAIGIVAVWAILILLAAWVFNYLLRLP